MNCITLIKSQAVKIAAALYYVESPNCMSSRFVVRSMRNGAPMASAETVDGAHRKAIRLAIGRARIAMSLPGVARENAAILAA